MKDASVPEPLRVLIVDDYPDAAESLAILLRAWGHSVRFSNNALEALEAARAFQPDATLIDIKMPGMDGYELAARLRNEEGLQPMAMIAVTGYADRDHRRRSEQEGFVLHLAKPIDLEQLSTFLLNLVEKKQQECLV